MAVAPMQMLAFVVCGVNNIIADEKAPRVNAARVVQREAVLELVSAVEQGIVSVSAAADIAASVSKEEQAEIVARGVYQSPTPASASC
jgi:hypothetical protein